MSNPSARRRFTLRAAAGLAGAIALNLVPGAASAQDAWPSKPVRIIVPFAAGSFTESAARTVGAELAQQLGQPFIVETKGGAGSTIGTDVVAKSPGDGYTLLFTDNSFMVSSALYEKLPYDPMKDIVQVSPAAEAVTLIMVRNDLPVRTLKELVDMARAKPNALNYGSGGQGSSAHLAVELFLQQAGVQMTHVPFKGVAASLMDVVAGRIDVGLSSVGTAGPHVKAGRLRALAITGKARHPDYPDVPTFAEAGFPDYQMTYIFGFMAPASTPAPIIERLQNEIAIAVQKPKVKQVFAATGAMPVSSSSADYRKAVLAESATWKRVIEKANIKP